MSMFRNLLMQRKDWSGKPADWSDIRKDCPVNSIALYAAHSEDFSQYDNLGFTATCTGGYNVFIDGVQYGSTYASGAQCSITWSTSGITTGDDITTPELLKAHKIWIEPATEGNNITVFQCQRVASSGFETQGILWIHYNIQNYILLANMYRRGGYYTSPVIAITAKNNLLQLTGSKYMAFYDENKLEYVPNLQFTSTGSTEYDFNNSNKIKTIIIKDFKPSNLTNSFSNLLSLNKCNLKQWDLSSCVHFRFLKAKSLNIGTLDMSNDTVCKKIEINGDSSNFVNGLKSMRVSNQAPFDNETAPQINISYTDMDRQALVTLFNDLPTVSNGQIINITACTGSSYLTPEEVDIAANKGWTIVGGINPAIVSGATSISLPNAVADSLTYVKLKGGTEQLAETYLDTVTAEGKCEQNGTPTPSSPVDIICNNGTIKVSPNLANMVADNITTGYYISNTGVVTADSANFIYNKYIPVKPNTTYTLSMSTSVYYITISEYSANDGTGFIQRNAGSAGTNLSLTITTQATTNYIRFGSNISLSTVTLAQVQAINWMLTESATAQDYMPYGQIYIDGTTETVTDNVGNVATCQNLLAIDTFKDTQEVIAGSITRNVGIKVFDGTEDWDSAISTKFYLDTDFALALNFLPTLCSHYQPVLTDRSSGVDNNQISLFINLRKGRIVICDSRFTIVSDFKQFLADQYANGTPVIVIYPLKTPTTETVTGQVLTKSPLTYSGSINGLTGTYTESSHTTPTPTQPLQINCNNGVVKVSQNLYNKNSYTEINAYINSNTGVLTQGSPGTLTQYCAVIPCLPNTTYTISGRASSAWGAFTSSTIGTTATSFNRTENGSITTGANDKYLIGLVRANQNVIDYRNTLQVEQGSTATPYRPYGQIYAEGTTETVEVTGQNLLDLANCVDGYYYNPDGVYSESSSARLSNFVKVQANEAYTVFVYGLKGSANVRVNLFDNNKTWLSQQVIASTLNLYTAITVTATQDGYLAFSANFATSGSCINWSLSQIVKGSYTVATMPAYEPYFNGGTATAEPLYKVSTYADIQEVLSGSVTRNVGVKVFNGTENWTYRNTQSGYATFILSNPFLYNLTSAPHAVCSHFEDKGPVNGISAAYSMGVGIALFKSAEYPTGRNLYLNIPTSVATDITTLKQYLADQYAAGTPVIVVYSLATATTETVTGQTLNVQQGSNTVEITQSSISGLNLEAKYYTEN